LTFRHYIWLYVVRQFDKNNEIQNIMKKPLRLKRVFSLETGIYANSGDFFVVLTGNGMKTTSKVDNLLIQADGPLHNPIFYLCKEDILLADVSVEELGLPNNSPYGKILRRGVGRSVVWKRKWYVLSKALPADGMALRISYRSQPQYEWLRIAMDGVEHPMGNKMIFRVVHGKDGVEYLDTDDGGDSDDLFDDHVRFVWRLIPLANSDKKRRLGKIPRLGLLV